MDSNRPGREAVGEQLEKILRSDGFKASEKLSGFLRYIVEETLAGRSGQLKAYTIAVEVFGREQDFDPQINPAIRVEAGRLRAKLEHYYVRAQDDPVRINVPKGTYVPTFSFAPESDVAEKDAPAARAPVPPADFAGRPTIAVLPFVNAGGDERAEYLVSGLAEEITIGLTRFQGLTVINAHAACNAEAGREDIFSLGARLGARFLLSGSAQVSTDVIRLRVTLSDVVTRNILWAEKFDGPITATELFSIQDRITEKVVARLADSFGFITRALVKENSSKGIDDLDVYEAILRYHHWVACLSPSRSRSAIEALERATKLAPDHALAKAMLADLYAADYQWGYCLDDKRLDLSMTLANQAVEMDANCQHAHWARAYNFFLRRDEERFLRSAEQAVRLNPSNTDIIGVVGAKMIMTGNYDEGLALLDRARELNPYHPSWYNTATYIINYLQGDFEAALAEAMHIHIPDFFWGPLMRAAALGRLHRQAEAALHIEDLLVACPDFPDRHAQLILTLLFRPEAAEAVTQGLLQAGLSF